MKIAKISQPWASLVMTEAIEFILPLDDEVANGEEILIYAIDKDDKYSDEYEKNEIGKLLYNEIQFGNLEENLEINCFLGYVKALNVFQRKCNKLYVHDVHCFVTPYYSKPTGNYTMFLSKKCKKKNYEKITYKRIKQPVQINVGEEPMKGYRQINEITIPLGEEAWKNLILNEQDVVFYWMDEFIGLTKWIDSFKDDSGFFDDEFDVVIKHKNKKVTWSMLNDDIGWDYSGEYTTDEKTGKKVLKATHMVLRIGISNMDCFYPDCETLNKERKRLLSPPKPEDMKRREWVHIIYTPMGNDRKRRTKGAK